MTKSKAFHWIFIFWQHVGAAVRKIKYPITGIRKKEEQIKELIHRSIDSDAVVDVFEMAGIANLIYLSSMTTF